MRYTWAVLPLIALAAPAGAQSYRAVGSAPYWRLTIDGAVMTLEQAGQRPTVVPREPAQPTAKGERYVSRGMTVDTIRSHCSDGASDRVYRDMVMVEHEGRTLVGCGSPMAGAKPVIAAPGKPVAVVPPKAVAAAPSKPVAAPPKPVAVPPKPIAAPPKPAVAAPRPAPAPPPKPALAYTGPRSILTDTHWTVWQVNGAALPAGQALTVDFVGNRIEGQLCNRFRGQFALTGEQLRVGNLAATRKACQGPVMTAETTLFAMWRGPVKATVSKWETLILTAGRDTVTLRPVR